MSACRRGGGVRRRLQSQGSAAVIAALAPPMESQSARRRAKSSGLAYGGWQRGRGGAPCQWSRAGLRAGCCENASRCVCVSHGVRNRFVRATAMPSLRGRALRERVVRGEGVRMRVCAITAFGGCVAFACPWKSAGNQLTNSAPRPCQSKKECTLAPYAVDARQLGCTPSALERSPTMRRRSRALLPVAQRLCPAQAPGRKLVRIVDRK